MNSMSSQLHDFMAPTSVPVWPWRATGRRAPPRSTTPGFRTTRLPSGLRLGLLDTPAGAEGGHLGLAEHALSLSLDGALGGLVRHRLLDRRHARRRLRRPVRCSWRGARPGRRSTFGPDGWGSARRSSEPRRRARSASLAADAVFAGLDAEAHLGGWRLFGGAELGSVSAEPNRRTHRPTSRPLTTSAFALRATLTGRQRSRSQPLGLPAASRRVRSGHALRSRGPHQGRRRPAPPGECADLAPTGRQIDVAARWHRRWTHAGELRLGAVWTRDPGHRRLRGPEPRPPRGLAPGVLTPARVGRSESDHPGPAPRGRGASDRRVRANAGHAQLPDTPLNRHEVRPGDRARSSPPDPTAVPSTGGNQGEHPGRTSRPLLDLERRGEESPRPGAGAGRDWSCTEGRSGCCGACSSGTGTGLRSGWPGPRPFQPTRCRSRARRVRGRATAPPLRPVPGCAGRPRAC